MPKEAIWLLPGLRIKRWFLMIMTGTIFATLGVSVLFEQRPVYFFVRWIRDVAKTVPTELIGIVFLIIGAVVFLHGWQRSSYSILDVQDKREKKSIFEILYRRRMLNRGPKVVAIGGGTGLSTLLKGIKNITNNITAVVTVGDDGGSSGRLREEMGVLPPGDIRNCIAALADNEDLMTELMQYRFKNGEGLEGHSFGNLFLTAMCNITGDMVRAVRATSNVLSIRGRVLPATLDDMRLVAEMEDGTIVKGESLIPEAKKKIVRLYSEPKKCKPLEDVLDAIRHADLIILGPGSLYTSVIPNLLISEISREISESNAKKVYICNIMTQPGETDDFTVSEHVKTILEHAKYPDIIDTVIVNDRLPGSLINNYKTVNSIPVSLDLENLKQIGINVEIRRLVGNDEKLVRHNPYKLSRAIFAWYRKNTGKNGSQQKGSSANVEKSLV